MQLITSFSPHEFVSNDELIAILNELPLRPMLAGQDGLPFAVQIENRQSITLTNYLRYREHVTGKVTLVAACEM